MVALPALAQADLFVDINGEERQPQLRTTFTVAARWAEDLPVNDVVVVFDIPGATIVQVHRWASDTVCETSVTSVRCTLAPAQDLYGGIAVSVAFPSSGTYVASARISSTSNTDPNPANDSDTHSIFAAGLPSLHAYGRAEYSEGNAFDPISPARISVGVSNVGEAPANLALRVKLPEGGIFTGVEPWSQSYCSIVSETEGVCRFDGPGDFGHAQYTFHVLTPDREEGGTFPFVVSAEADGEDFDPADDTDRVEVLLRDLIAVTNAEDQGPGSLRQAMLDSRNSCADVPCVIARRSATPLLIQPKTALPELRGRVKIEGGGRTMVLDGTLLPVGDAIRFVSGCEFRVNGMGIRNFAGGHAIEVYQNADPERPRDCQTSLFATPISITASELAHNLRGIVTKNVRGAAIDGNDIHDNQRAGIFADGGYYVRIEENQIARNGASGIFINASFSGGPWLPPGADVFANVIRDNGEWGIARTPAGSVNIQGNAIFGNNLYAIDYGLDLSTPGAPNKPEITSAFFDPERNATVIRGRVAFATGFGGSIQLYASSSLSRWGYPEAERFLKVAYARDGEFEAVVEEDLRGKWITATGTTIIDVIFLRDAAEVRQHGYERYQANDTSELSAAFRVE